MSLESFFSRIFAGKDGAEEKHHLNSWRNDYKDNLEGLNQLTQIWNNAEGLKDYQTFDTQNAYNQFIRKTELSRPSRIRPVIKYFYGFAAIGIMLFCSILLLNNYFLDNSMQHIVALEDKLVELPDGSSIQLFKGSAIEYKRDFNQNRSLILNGDAFFKVKPNANSSFEVTTSNAKVKVLGTSFLVREFKDYTSVGVAEGKVSVHNNSNEQLLIAGDIVEIGNSFISPSVWSESDISKVPDLIMANGEELENIFSILFKGSGWNYKFKSDIPECQINAFFYNQTIEDIVQEISLICGFSYIQEAEIFVIE